ncbi:class I SAM-dependent methyltransferase [Candidatus Magnetominusculus dajiuhuensis]|uniref:class I SAM-dependent methyltransferase n=1 Tax=Candidatus Magnetominusculus dajiuhuensis TaxID=3137712 RepID=UPI003B4304EC
MMKLIHHIQFSSVLEVGCGNGMNLFVLDKLRHGIELAGMDVSRTALLELQNILPHIKSYQMDITKEYLPQKFDLVICFDVLEHINDDVSALTNISRMTGTYLLLSTLQGKMREFERYIGHVRNYKLDDLKQKIISSGFKLITTIQWGWPFYSPLYRNILEHLGVQRHTEGEYGFLKRAVCILLYKLFSINSHNRGDMVFILAKKNEEIE